MTIILQRHCEMPIVHGIYIYIRSWLYYIIIINYTIKYDDVLYDK